MWSVGRGRWLRHTRQKFRNRPRGVVCVWSESSHSSEVCVLHGSFFCRRTRFALRPCARRLLACRHQPQRLPPLSCDDVSPRSWVGNHRMRGSSKGCFMLGSWEWVECHAAVHGSGRGIGMCRAERGADGHVVEHRAGSGRNVRFQGWRERDETLGGCL